MSVCLSVHPSFHILHLHFLTFILLESWIFQMPDKALYFCSRILGLHPAFHILVATIMVCTYVGSELQFLPVCSCCANGVDCIQAIVSFTGSGCPMVIMAEARTIIIVEVEYHIFRLLIARVCCPGQGWKSLQVTCLKCTNSRAVTIHRCTEINRCISGLPSTEAWLPLYRVSSSPA